MTMHTRTQLEKKLPQFKDWLTARGAQVLVPTNAYEVLRFRAGNAVAIVYAKGTGALTYDGVARAALDAFVSQGNWTAGVKVKRSKKTTSEVGALLYRDGSNCFLCCLPLGDDITVEHLVPVIHGGPNHIANKALAHLACNQRMGHLSVMEKVALRDHHRSTH